MQLISRLPLYLTLSATMLTTGHAAAANLSNPVLPRRTSTPPALQQRIAAAQATAKNNPACTAIAPFYWEVGDRDGKLASGSLDGKLVAAPTADTTMPIASASKWLFSTYVAEQRSGSLTASDIKFLTFQSGYTNFSACSVLSSVSSCLSEAGDRPGSNGQYIAATDGKFYYNGGHMQVLAASMGIGPDHDARLATDMQAVLGSEIAISYTEPQLAGGIQTSANGYAHFLRNLLSGKYSHMATLLGSHAVCTHTNSASCPNALFSPVNQTTPGGSNNVSDESWHYSLGHWVEDDPKVGDGAYSSPGRFGFYPWVDHDKTWYGVLARHDPLHVGADNPKQASYITSVDCGRLIRAAWLKGVPQ